MKYFIIFFIIISLPLLSKERDAVMLKITSDLKVSKTTFDIFRSGAEMSLTKSNYVLLDEKAQEEALKSQSSQDGCLDDSCLIDTGRMLAAKILFVVSIKKVDKEVYLFNAKTISLETSTTERSFSLLYKHSLKDIVKLFKFSKDLTTSTLNVRTKRSLWLSKDMSYLSPYLKLGGFSSQFHSYFGESVMDFLYLGGGIKLIEFDNKLIMTNININTIYNITDSYLVVDLSGSFLFNIIKNLNIGIELGIYLANNNIIPKVTIATEYRIDFGKNLFLNFDFDIGLFNYSMIKGTENGEENISYATYVDLSTSIGWDF